MLCYEVTADVREAVVAFDVTLLANGAARAGPFRADAAVGRGTARVELDAPPATYDVRVQLLVDGEPLEGAVVTVTGVKLARTAPQARCD